MNAPQIIAIIILTVGMTMNIARHGKQHEYNLFIAAVGTAMWVGILVWGGFFD